MHSAKVVLYSVNFAEIEERQHQGKWDENADILADAALNIEKGSADFLLICTNTMHKVAPQIGENISIPLLHIADATAEKLVENGVKTVGLPGTAFTMEQEFYKGRLTEKFDIDVIVPDQDDRQTVHNIIYQELCKGEIKESSRQNYLSIIDRLKNNGAEAVILGCTEIALLVQQQHTSAPPCLIPLPFMRKPPSKWLYLKPDPNKKSPVGESTEDLLFHNSSCFWIRFPAAFRVGNGIPGSELQQLLGR